MGSLDLLREVSVLSEHKTLLLSIVLFSEQIPRYFAVTICLSRGFLKCSFLKTGREGFRSWGSPLWIMPPNCPFLSPILVSYQMHPENFWCVPPKRSIPILQLSVEKNSLDLSLEKHNLGRLFFLSQQQLCLEYLLFSNPRWGYFSSSMSKKRQRMPQMHLFPRLVTPDTRDDADNYMTIIFILSTMDKECF